MHLFHVPQYFIENRNVHISVLNGALWDMEQVHSRICELGQLPVPMQMYCPLEPSEHNSLEIESN